MRIIAGLVGLFALLMGGAAVAAVNRKQQIAPIDDEDANDVALVAIFGPVMFHSTATAFRGGTLDCWYGGGIVDLRDATLDPGGAHLEIKTVFGGAQILVPDSWRVESTVAGLGAAQDVRAKADRPVTAPLLTLSGFAVLGGIGVTSTIDEETLEQVTEAVEEARHAKDEAQAELHAAQTEAASSI